MKRRYHALLFSLLLIGSLAGCREDTTEADAGADTGGDPDAERGECDALTNVDCVEIQRGETVFHRWLSDYESFEIDDEGETRTVIRLTDLIDQEIAEDPSAWRYQAYGTDGYTYGGYATWTHFEHGYMELGIRKLIFEPSQELPHSYRVRDTYLIVLVPGG